MYMCAPAQGESNTHPGLHCPHHSLNAHQVIVLFVRWMARWWWWWPWWWWWWDISIQWIKSCASLTDEEESLQIGPLCTLLLSPLVHSKATALAHTKHLRSALFFAPASYWGSESISSHLVLSYCPSTPWLTLARTLQASSTSLRKSTSASDWYHQISCA